MVIAMRLSISAEGFEEWKYEVRFENGADRKEWMAVCSHHKRGTIERNCTMRISDQLLDRL